MEAAKRALIIELRKRYHALAEDVQALFEDGFISYEAYLRIDKFALNATYAEIELVEKVGA